MAKAKKTGAKSLKMKEGTQEENRKKAYEIYEKSGCVCGRDMDNWLEAERVVNCK